MKLLICGGRDFSDYHRLEVAMNQLGWKPSIVINGGARGADTLGRDWAKANGVYPVTIDALWNYLGSSKAGPARNQAMIDIMRPDYCLALPGGSGTADMVRRCRESGIQVWQPYG